MTHTQELRTKDEKPLSTVKKKSSWSKVLKEFLDFASSVQVAVILLALAAIATLVGSTLPQEVSLEKVFFSSWYLTLMLCMYFSIILASFKRVFPKARKAFSFDTAIPANTYSSNFVVKEQSSAIDFEKLSRAIKKQGFKIYQNNKSIFAIKGAIHKLGASTTHVGIILTITGALYGMLTGFGGFMVLSPGEEINLKDSEIKRVEAMWFGKVPDLRVKVLKTWREDYEDGSPKQYYSDIELYDSISGELLQKHPLKVNFPLKYKDFYIYQNTYGEYLQIAFNNKTIDLGIQKFGDLDVGILDISPGFTLHFQAKGEGDSESVVVNAIGNGDQITRLGEFKKGQAVDLGPEDIRIDFRYLGKGYVTGLQYKSNPGAILLYMGFAILIIGIFLAFGSKQELWAYRDQESGDIIVLGKVDKFKKQFKRELTDLIEQVKTT